jgi:hypothetical protein
MGRMNKLTVLGATLRGFGGVPPGRSIGDASRRQRLTGSCDPGGERRYLVGVGEGPAEAVAGVNQVSMGVERTQFVKKFVSEQWILSCKSLGRPLVYHL